MRTRLRAAVAIAAVAAASVVASAPPRSFCDEPGWSTIFADDFDGPELNVSNWEKHLGGGDSSVRDSQGLAKNVYIENGALVLRTLKERHGSYNYTSGAVQGAAAPTSSKADCPVVGGCGRRSWMGPARACVRAQLPGAPGGRGTGIWPALWMMPDTPACWPGNGEVDILEMIDGDGIARQTYHWTAHPVVANHSDCSGGDKQRPKHYTLGAGWDHEFHEYAVEYSETHVAFAVDGQVIGNTTNGQLTLEGRARVYDVPYYFILNTAVSTAPHEVGWVHPVTPKTVFPTYHRIDSVRVVQRKGNDE